MEYVIGVDLGTSSVKALLVDQWGSVCGEASSAYPLIQQHSGWSEQDPEVWVERTIDALHALVTASGVQGDAVKGISFSGQMHGLVLLDEDHQVIRNAILWNDTRTSAECRRIEERLGERLLATAKNRALEGFTLPKLLWVQHNEPDHFARAKTFLLPKDYLRFRLTGNIAMEPSDAAGTILFDVANRRWSDEVVAAFDLPRHLCPPIVDSDACVGTLLPEVAARIGLAATVRVFAGGADNACGAIGAGILSQGQTMCSMGTSGVILHHEQDGSADYQGKLHFFNHAQPRAFYSMGVTLAAGYSLTWFRDTFVPNEAYDDLLARARRVPPGAEGLLFAPYLVGERTPYADANIRGSFIGVDASHTLDAFARAVVEGITFSLRDAIEILRGRGRRIERIVSIGGGAKSDTWLQIQADIFNSEVVRLHSEQGPAFGAAMIAAVGCEWYPTLEACARVFLKEKTSVHPIPENVRTYQALYHIYREIYESTRRMNEKLQPFRR
ncbi:xylulokinase [Alicyclobacillus cycloheptanicus]|uniref:Xylulose kinase n=1 Tax=Alicyclobacillus cycloheptanicus TaxID=1457 RepID=A0ABT9XGG7_9BACL|nr:xylulokinase [Alicyclobacillus cycloheptanicus]MDQ0189387.1 xylulokinase [Alicyclobacillus cycloheptanicus]WDM02263.1 xylulokinase [Alicyclobacillus cycloheptanicus]